MTGEIMYTRKQFRAGIWAVGLMFLLLGMSGGASAAPFYTETFTGTASTDLAAHTSDSGATYTRLGIGTAILTGSNALHCQVAGGSNNAATYISSVSAPSTGYDYLFSLTFQAGTANPAGVVFREQDSTHYWTVQFNNFAGQWQLIRDSTTIATATSTLTVGHTYICTVQNRPNSIIFVVSDNGAAAATIISYTGVAVSTYAAATGIGVYLNTFNGGATTSGLLLSALSASAPAVATGVALTPPATLTGPVGAETGAFTVGPSPPGSVFSGSVPITISDGTAGFFFPASTVTLSAASPTYTFSYAPLGVGVKAIAVTNTAGLTNPASATYTPVALTVGQFVWNPLMQQYADADTTLLFDAGQEQALLPGTDGFFSGKIWTGSRNPWGSAVQVIPGKYRQGINPLTASGGTIWEPIEGLMSPDQFTVEMWVQSTADLTAAAQTFATFGSLQTGLPLLVIAQSGNTLRAVLTHQQGATTAQIATASVAISAGQYPANTWTNLSATFDGSLLKLFINGVLSATSAAIATPRVWSCSSLGEGVLLCGPNYSSSATTMTISDLRISHIARVPNVAAAAIPRANILTIASLTPTGTSVNPLLLGVLHGLSSQTETMAAGTAGRPGIVKVLRFDHVLQDAPIVAGGVDATHPTAGHSGLYSYDWQVLDRTLADQTRLGIIPYLSIDGTPSILGGMWPPLTGTFLTTGLDGSGPNDLGPTPPNDFSAYGTMSADLIYHIVVEKGVSLARAGLWNEPDGGQYWSGTQLQYQQLYAQVAAKIRAAVPGVKLGGPEGTPTTSGVSSWIPAFIQYCATNSLPLDFISYHPFNGAIGTASAIKSAVGAAVTSSGLGRSLELLDGETLWDVSNFPDIGAPSWFGVDMFKNDWSGAFMASFLIEEQASSVVYHIQATGVEGNNYPGYGNAALINNAPKAYAGFQPYRMWTMLAPSLLASSYSGFAPVQQQASVDPTTGRITVLVSYLKYRKDSNPLLTLQLPVSLAGKTVNDYVVDDNHSNAFEQGISHSPLEQVAGTVVQTDGTVTITLRPRSAHLIEIGGPVLGGTKRRLQ